MVFGSNIFIHNSIKLHTYMVFKGLHALFLIFRGCHIQMLITPEIFVIEAICLQF